ncbi:MAG TPA: hypothetical protein VHZ33_01390 [Trebonia sp.]|jgi:hypothetical protein|nr:hypothetical protein [Trebonia sp.]
MSSYRRPTLALAACAALLTAGCSAGITSASPPKAPATPASHHPASHHPAPPATHTAAPSPSPSLAASSASVPGLGSFPIPAGAQVAANFACGKGDAIEAGPVTPAAAAAFYTVALPAAGYTMTTNTLGSVAGSGRIETVIFTGHGYSGVIIAMANVSSAGSGAASAPALSGSLSHNVLEIILAPGSTPGSMPKC